MQANTVDTLTRGSEHVRQPSATPILARDWSGAYATDANTATEWSSYLQGRSDFSKWPKGLRAYGDTLHFNGQLLIPSSLELEWIVELHDLHHACTAKMAPDLIGRTCVQDANRKLAEVRWHFQKCQASTHRNWLPEGKLTPHPVPPRPFSSMCTDIFADSKAKDFQGDHKDKIILVTCRHSGFIVGWAAHEKGLTSETVAREYADRILLLLGVPTEITSDNGPQYAATIWRTLHHLPGTRAAYGEAYRPQSNVKAEWAGKSLDDMFWKISLDFKLPWLEVIPLGIAAYNDILGESGFSLHQLLFGRERLDRGLELPTDHETEDVVAFMDRMRSIDELSVDRLRSIREARKATYNKQRLEPHHYKVND